MKKLICLILGICFIVTGCNSAPKAKENTVAECLFTRGVWLSFSEIDGFLKSERGFEAELSQAVENLKAIKATDLYLHIRSHCDSIVKSEYFPQRESSKAVEYDILQRVLEACHKENIRVHAWINPYRVSSLGNDASQSSSDSPVTRWLTDETPENDKNVILTDGIYLNPSEGEVRQLIVSGVREIITNYDVDGIHFDDYFYPSTDLEIDSQSYTAYTQATVKPLSRDDWRRANVEALISDCRTAIDLINKNVIFSVSPSADIEKNYNTHYADVVSWAKNGLIDQIIPQLYFGFKHTDSDFCFDSLLEKWTKACKSSKAEIKIGLAAYKIGTASPTDGEEWSTCADIIARQTKACMDAEAISGVCYFSYSSLFSEELPNTAERQNVINIFQS